MSNSDMIEYSIYEAVAEHDHLRLLGCIEEVVISAARTSVLHHSGLSTSKSKSGESKMDESHTMPISLSHIIEKLHRDEFIDDADYLASKPYHDSRFNRANRTQMQDFADACKVLTETEIRHVTNHLVNCNPPLGFKVRQPSSNSLSENPLQNRNKGELESAFDSNGSLLHLACICDNQIALAILLLFGADIRSRHTTFRRLPIHEAVCWDSHLSLRVLLHISTLQDHCVSRFGHQRRDAQVLCYNQRSFFDVLRYIRELCSDIPVYDTHYSEKAFRVAIEIVETLVNEFPLDTILQLTDAPLQMDGHGNTAIHWSAFKNSIKCLQVLLDSNHSAAKILYANIRSNQSGWTPLHDAAYSNSHECIALLIKAGANVNACANSGATPLCFAAQEDAEQATKLLLDNGANAKLRCSGNNQSNTHDAIGISTHRFSGYTPLHYCAHYNASRSARILLNESNNEMLMEMLDFSQKMPIHVAALRGSSDVLRELLAAGAHLSKENSMFHTLSLPHHGFLNQSPLSTSPILRAMLPRYPVQSSKPWNCLLQKNIDECTHLLNAAESHWSPKRHHIFTPSDRTSVATLLRVGKRLEQERGIFIDFIPLVLSFCGRAWFDRSYKHDRSSARVLNKQHFPSPLLTSSRQLIRELDLEENDESGDDNNFSNFQLDTM